MPIVVDFERELFRQSPAAFGRWHKVDLHNHSPMSLDYKGDKSAALEQSAKRIAEAGLDVVMFTDHERLPQREFVEALTERTGKLILRGAELNIFVDAWSKPSGKVEKNLYFHLLVGFDPDGPQDPDYWITHIYKVCANEVRDTGSHKVLGFTASVENICDALSDAGAIIIPAHLHSTRDAFKSRSVDDIYADKQFLKLAQDRFTALEVTDISTASYFDGNHVETNRLEKTCIRSSDAHTPEMLGTRVTYLQMEQLTFAELRASLQMPFRVSLVPPKEPASFIVGVNVRGQFYPDLWLSMSPHCNAMIGVKGSGKTSVLECLRFALGSPVPSSRQEDVTAHLQSILGPAGIVRVLIKRRDGSRLLVERSSNAHDDFALTFLDDRRVIVQNPDALMFPSYILGWHEIEQAATDPNIRQVYLDTIAGRERIRQLQEKAETGANQVRLLHAQASSRYSTYKSLSEQVKRLEDLRSGLTELTEAQLIELRDTYDVAVGQREAINQLRRVLRKSAKSIATRAETISLHSQASAFGGVSPLSNFAERAALIVTELQAHVDSFTQDQKQRLLASADVLDREAEAVEAAFADFAKTYSAAVNSLDPEKQKLLQSYREVMEDTKALPRLRAEMEAEKVQLDAELSDLVRICNDVADSLDQQTHLREEKIAELNSQLESFGVRLEVAPLAMTSAFDGLRGQFTTGAAIFDQLNTFASGERRHHRRLAQGYESLRSDLLGGFFLFFTSSDFGGYLGAFEGDDLKISFAVGKDGEPYSPIDQLSAGQRCTAVFPLLLKLREGPLIVDQPEDNLDNRHIADTIAPALLTDKCMRQIAFTSHNANLVVLTDAEQIAMFEATGSKGRVQSRGFLCTSASTIARDVIAILDGGSKALELRYQKYGFRSQG